MILDTLIHLFRCHGGTSSKWMLVCVENEKQVGYKFFRPAALQKELLKILVRDYLHANARPDDHAAFLKQMLQNE